MKHRVAEKWSLRMSSTALRVQVEPEMERMEEEVRVTILGHVQRGGAPSAYDRLMGTLLGHAAVHDLMEAGPESTPQLVGVRHNRITRRPLAECVEATLEIAAAAGIWYLRIRLNTDEGRLWWDRVRLRLPTVGPIFLSLAVARFCRVLGTLLRNGVPILRGLSISSDATANRVLGEAIHDASENISAGEPLADPLAASGQFPPAVVEMIAVAEQANNL